MVDALGGEVYAVALYVRGCGLHDIGQFFFKLHIRFFERTVHIRVFGVFIHEARDVPELVREVLVAFYLVFAKREVGARRIADDKRHAERVGAVLIGERKRIDDVAFGLRHLLPVRIVYEPVEIHGRERHGVGEIEAEYNHARDPEEENVAPGLHQVSRVVSCVFSVRVSGHQERPLPGREPGIKRIGVLSPTISRTFYARFPLAILVPCGNRDAPDDLAADVPIVRIFHPVTESLLLVFRNEADVAFVYGGHRHRGKRRHLHEPLVLHLRFNHRGTFVALFHDVFVRLVGFYQKTFRGELLHYFRARLLDAYAGKFLSNREEFSAPVDDLLHGKAVTLRDFEVDLRVPGGDGHDTRTKLHIGGIVLDDGCRNRAVYPFHFERIAVLPFAIALVVRMHDDVLVAELCFRTHGAYLKRSVLKRIERRGLLDAFGLHVRKGGLVLRAPVHGACAAIHEPVVEHLHEGLLRFLHEVRVERELLARPVTGCAECADLSDHIRLVCEREGEDFLVQSFRVHPEARAPFFLKLPLIHDLRLESRVVSARYPKCAVAAHTLEAGNEVLERYEKRVACVEVAVCVRRRHDDGKGLALRLCE